MAKKNGGAAFARSMGHNGYQHVEDHDTSSEQDGMSLLDYFAGEALPLAHAETLAKECPPHAPIVARRAYDLAEAMVDEHNKREGKHGD